MCGCLAVVLGAFFPRVGLLLIWFFSTWIQQAFNGEWILPVLGWFLLPYTTLSYVMLHLWLGEVTGFTWAFVVLAFLLDIGSVAGSTQARR